MFIYMKAKAHAGLMLHNINPAGHLCIESYNIAVCACMHVSTSMGELCCLSQYFALDIPYLLFAIIIIIMLKLLTPLTLCISISTYYYRVVIITHKLVASID